MKILCLYLKTSKKCSLINTVILLFTGAGLLHYFYCGGTTNLADINYEQGEYEKAIEIYQQLIAEDPENVNAYIGIGSCYTALQRYEEALSILKKASDFPTTTDEAKKKIREVTLLIAQDAHAKNNIRTAINAYKRLLRQDPKNPDYNFTLAMIYKENNYILQAKEYLERVVVLDPDYKTAAVDLTGIQAKMQRSSEIVSESQRLFSKQEYDRALKLSEEALTYQPDSKEALYLKHNISGMILYRKGGSDDIWSALNKFADASAVFPERAEAYYRMGLAFEKKDREDYDTPIKWYEKALELEPEGPFAKDARTRIKKLKETKEKMRKFWGYD